MTLRIPVAGKLLLVAGLAVAVLLPGCSRSDDDPWNAVPGGPPRVLVSFAPLYCFAKAVAGPDVAVLSLLTTTGPHDFAPDGGHLLAARKADLFLVNGLTLDDFVTNILASSGNGKKDVIQKLGAAIPANDLIRIAEGEHHHHAPGEKCNCAHGEHDPHVWLGVPEAALMVQRIADLLAQKDPAHKDGYRARADAYVKQLHQFLADGKELLKDKKNRKFITNHHSFRYFARAFGLEVLDSIQMQPGVEADAGQMARLVKLCKKHNVRVIGVEPQYSRAAAETLQSSLRKDLPDLVIVELDPIETITPEYLSPDYYLQRMRANVENLAKHLQ